VCPGMNSTDNDAWFARMLASNCWKGGIIRVDMVNDNGLSKLKLNQFFSYYLIFYNTDYMKGRA
jgi:hypothetical protein